ncbi:hypothetical protein QBC39DRAFT_367681 [Podospora conica]|nr:hypothetical protein QBC39DRAFT_367681 [Schizothecium conicum]
MSPLVYFPYELLALVVGHLDLPDIRSFSRTCRYLQYLFYEDKIARVILENEAPDSLEARTARITKRYARELRRLVKRREAITSVSPYLVAVVAVTDSWMYENGVLCHILDRQMRILDLHNSQSTEIVVDIRGLLDVAVHESRPCRNYKFQPLHVAHGLVSCLYSHANPDTARWLVVFNAREGRVVTTKRLRSSFKIFVRNNSKFLCYGAYSEGGRDGSRLWIVRGYDLTKNTWLSGKLDLPEPMGSDVGSTVCFEVIDGFLYSVSNQTSLEDEEGDWMSFYTCFRFPLTQQGLGPVQHAPREQLWRRCHFEGPIDDRWSFLRIFKDEQTSQITVVESRKEWLSKSSSARRTYYTTKIVFPAMEHSREGPSKEPLSERHAESSKMAEVDFTTAPDRDPHSVHPGDDGSKSIMHTLTKSPVRIYDSATQTFLDLVDDSTSFDPDSLCLRIRGGTRRRWTAAEFEERNRLPPETRHVSHDTFDQQIEDLYKQEDVIYWPPKESPAEPDAALLALHGVLNPYGHSGQVRGVWDDRSMAYSIDGTGKTKALVFLSFDPAISLEGVKAYPGNPACSSSAASPCNGTVPEAVRSIGEEKGKGTSSASGPNGTKDGNPAFLTSESSVPVGDEGPCQWRKLQRAMYRDISVGFHFAA